MDNPSVSDTFSGTLGVTGLLSVIISLICIALAWWSLQNLKLDLIIRNPRSPQGRLLQLLLAIVLGHFVSNFLIDYISWTQMIRYMF